MGWLRGALLAVLLVAAALRFSALQSAPPGFWYDEGLNGQFARAVLAGDWRVFYGDREGLFFYLLAGAITLLGDSIFALRWLPAAVGVLTVAATFALGRRLLGTGTGAGGSGWAGHQLLALRDQSLWRAGQPAAVGRGGHPLLPLARALPRPR